MNTNDFNKPVTARRLNESMYKKFGASVDLEKYTRDQLEGFRNILRARLQKEETSSGFNELQTNESHQRDKYMLSVINTRIKEMLGESIENMERALAEAKKTKEDEDCGCDAELKEAPSTGLTKKQKSQTAKDAKAGKDIGKPGKNFKKVADKAAKEYGSKETGEKVAAAAMWKNKSKKIKESVDRLLVENEEEKAQIISAGIDMVQDFTSWMQRIGSYQTKSMLEMGDDIRSEFGRQKSEEFKSSVTPALSNALEVLTHVREQLSTAIAVLAGEAEPESDMMGAEVPPEADDTDLPDMGSETPDMAPADDLGLPSADEFAASDAAAGGAEPTGRARRESKEVARMNAINEAHSIMSILTK